MKRHVLGEQITLPFNAGSSGDFTVFPMTSDGSYYYIVSYSQAAVAKTADFSTFTYVRPYPSALDPHYTLVKAFGSTVFFGYTNENTYDVFLSYSSDGFYTETTLSLTYTQLRRCIDVIEMTVGGVVKHYFVIEGEFYDETIALVASDTTIQKQSVGFVKDDVYYFLAYDGTNVWLCSFDGSTITKIAKQEFGGTISELYHVILDGLEAEDLLNDIMITTGVAALRFLASWNIMDPTNAVMPVWESDYSYDFLFAVDSTASSPWRASLKRRIKAVIVTLQTDEYSVALKAMGGYDGYICQDSFVMPLETETIADFVKVQAGWDFYHEPFCQISSTQQYDDNQFLFLYDDSMNLLFGGWYRNYQYDLVQYSYDLESPIRNDLLRKVSVSFSSATVSQILETVIRRFCLTLQTGTIDATTDTYDISFDGKTILDIIRWCDNMEGKVSVFRTDFTLDWTAFPSTGLSLTVGVDSISKPDYQREALHISRVELWGGFDTETGERITAIAQNNYEYGTYRDSYPEITSQADLQALADKILSNLNLSITTLVFDYYNGSFIEHGTTLVITFDDAGISGDTFYIYGVIYKPLELAVEIKAKSALYIPPLNQETESLETTIKINNLEQQVSQVSTDLASYIYDFGFGPSDRVIFLKNNYTFQELQDAVDYLCGLGGGKLFVPSGCAFTDTLTISGAIEIIGSGNTLWYPDPSVTGSLSIMVSITGDDVRISGIKMDISTLATGSADYGFLCYGDRIIIEKCYLIGGSSDSEYLIDIRGSGCIVRNNMIEDSTASTYFGIRATTSSDHTIIEGNRVNGCTYGIANYGPHSVITGNIADGCTTDGIFVYVSKTTTGAYVSITGNTCIGGGITVYYSQYVNLTGNMCEDLAITSCDNVVYVGNSASTITTTGSTLLTTTGNGW